MTIQELKDLVRLKIAGQGTMVDAGGALPPVLNGILDTLAATQNVESVVVTVDGGEGTPSADATFADGVLTLAFHNLKGEKGDQGNTGSSVDYPFELVNNVTTDDATKALSAAQGVVLDNKISQLGQELPNKANVDGIYETLVAGGALSLVAKTAVESEFTFDQIPAAADDGRALLKNVKGNSLVWNQLIPSIDTFYATNASKTITGDICSFTATAQNGNVSVTKTGLVAGHKYLFSCAYKATSGVSVRFRLFGGYKDVYKTGTGSWEIYSEVFTQNSIGSNFAVWDTRASDWDEISFQHMMLIDLTQMFGAGNEPTSVAEFEKLFPQPYYDYNPGEIISNKTEGVKLVGFNQWDEEWEVGGINAATGTDINMQQIRSKNHFPILPNTAYYLKTPQNITVSFYDANKVFLGFSPAYYQKKDTVITTPLNAHFARFSVTDAYGTTYNHDICINISDANRNGEYEPYKTSTISLNLPTLTGKLLDAQGQPTGESVVINPEGMAGQGEWADYCIVEGEYITKIVKQTPRVAVDLGDLNYNKQAVTSSYPNGYFIVNPILQNKEVGNTNLLCSGYNIVADWGTDKSVRGSEGSANVYIKDSAYASATTTEFKTAMAGVKLIYQLDTPEIYLLDNPIPVPFQSYAGGTMMQLPQNGSEPTTAPMVMAAQYPMDVEAAVNHILQVLANNNLS